MKLIVELKVPEGVSEADAAKALTVEEKSDIKIAKVDPYVEPAEPTDEVPTYLVTNVSATQGTRRTLIQATSQAEAKRLAISKGIPGRIRGLAVVDRKDLAKLKKEIAAEDKARTKAEKEGK